MGVLDLTCRLVYLAGQADAYGAKVADCAVRLLSEQVECLQNGLGDALGAALGRQLRGGADLTVGREHRSRRLRATDVYANNGPSVFGGAQCEASDFAESWWLAARHCGRKAVRSCGWRAARPYGRRLRDHAGVGQRNLR